MATLRLRWPRRLKQRLSTPKFVESTAGVRSDSQASRKTKTDSGGSRKHSQPVSFSEKNLASPVFKKRFRVPGARAAAAGDLGRGVRSSRPSSESPLLNVSEVARRLGVCTATVYTLCDRGALAHVRVLNAVRFSKRNLDEFVRRRAKLPPL